MGNFPHWVDHILAFLFCIALPLYAARQRTKGTAPIHFNSDQKKQFYISASFSLFVMGVIVVSVWLIFGRPIAELGLTQPANFRSW